MLIKQNSLFKNKYSICIRRSKMFIKLNIHYVFCLDAICYSMIIFSTFGYNFNKHEKNH